MLGLELGHVVRILEDVPAVVQDEDVPIVGKAVDRAFDHHLVVAVDRRDAVELLAVSVFVHERVQRLQRAGKREVRHLAGKDVQDVVSAPAAQMVLHGLGEHLVVRGLDDIDLDPGQLLPKRTGEILGIERLQTCLVEDVQRDPGVLLRRLHGALGRRLGKRTARAHGQCSG